MITFADYFMGRRETHPLDLTPSIETEAQRTVDLANELLAAALADGIEVEINPGTGSQVSSGWRPPGVNSNTPGAATNSKHMTGQAIDLNDHNGKFKAWLMTGAGQAALMRIGLWMEAPASTPTWAHVQSKPPGSGRRVFNP